MKPMVKVHLQMGWLSCKSSLCPVDGTEGVRDFCLPAALPHLPGQGGVSEEISICSLVFCWGV